MRVLVIGATGTIGQAAARALAERHEVIAAGQTRGEYRVDIAERESIEALYRAVGPVDAVVVAAGWARFGALPQLTDADFQFSLANKLMGQINVVRCGLETVRDQGSFTLTSGLYGRYPDRGTAALSLVNAALEGFVGAAALDLPRGIRINIVSPPWVAETLTALGRDPARGLPAARLALAYLASVEGKQTGQVLDGRTFA